MFRAVAQYGGFSHASQAIHKSQSSIHHAVQKLEETLNLKLFEVNGRKMNVTETGKLMLQRANYLLDEAARIEAVAQSIYEGTENQLRIAVDEICPLDMITTVLGTISAQYPMLTVELTQSTLSGSNELLDNTSVDIAISPYPTRTGFCEELCTIDFVAVAHPTHALHGMGRMIELEDLRSHRQIVVRDSSTINRQDDGWLLGDPRWTVSQLNASVNMISKGFGFAWLPLCMILREINAGILKPLPLQHSRRRSGQLYLIYDDADRLGPAAKAFLGELRHQCLELPTLESVLPN